MATWTLLLMTSPRNTFGGTGLVTPLTRASGISLGFSVNDIETLSFSLPGRHYQTALIEEGVSDVIAYRDELVIQRFRVVSMAIGASGTNVTVSVTCSSYKEVVNGWLIHEEDSRNYPVLAGQSADDVAWAILDEGQSKPDRNLGMTRGLAPADPLADHTGYEPDDVSVDLTPLYFFAAGESRMAAIDRIGAVVDGFDWSIDPDPADPLGALKANFWNRGERHTDGFPSGLSNFLLSEASMASWSTTRDMSNYANVLRVTGGTPTDNTVITLPADAEWRPADKNPDLSLDRGAWEALVTTDSVDQDEVARFADEQYALHTLKAQEWTCALMPGRWQGPSDFWVGDICRVLLRVETLDDSGRSTGEYLLDVDDAMRVVTVNIGVGTSGSEDVTLQLNRPIPTLFDQLYKLRRQINNIQRR
jgi:hypothetical protein